MTVWHEGLNISIKQFLSNEDNLSSTQIHDIGNLLADVLKDHPLFDEIHRASREYFKKECYHTENVEGVVRMNMEQRIAVVYLWQNGLTMVFDQNGEQMVDYQGDFDDMVDKIKHTYQGEWIVADWLTRQHASLSSQEITDNLLQVYDIFDRKVGRKL